MPRLDRANWFSDADFARSEGDFQAAGLIGHRQLSEQRDDPTAVAFAKDLVSDSRSRLAPSHLRVN